MQTYRVELLRDTLIKGKPMKKGTLINVDPHMYDYLWGCACIKDAEPEVAPATPVKAQAQTKAKK